MAIANLPKLNFSVPLAMTAALPVEYNAYFNSYDEAVAVTAADNGKFLRVVDGVWAAATVPNANGVSF